MMEPNRIQKENTRFEELDSLRGIASIIVLLFHYTMGRKECLYGFNLGVTGVDLFFIISGFVIFFSIERTKSIRNFFINRFYRIYPTYWLGASYTFIVILSYSILTKDYSLVDVKQFLLNLTMIQFYFGVQDVEGPYWTMLVELIFYVYIAVFYRFSKSFNFITMIIISMTLILVHFFYQSDFIFLFYKIPFLQFTPLFFAGIIFYKKKMNLISNLKFIVYLIFCYFAQLLLFNFSGKSMGQVTFFQYWIMLTIYFLVFYFFIENKMKFLINKVLIFLGRISFVLYLIHYRVSVNFIIPILMKKYFFSLLTSSIIALIITVVISAFITFYVEKKFVSVVKMIISWRYIFVNK
jgi:peptidoglycan/LPS O-acetylase OafA/YrhL